MPRALKCPLHAAGQGPTQGYARALSSALGSLDKWAASHPLLLVPTAATVVGGMERSPATGTTMADLAMDTYLAGPLSTTISSITTTIMAAVVAITMTDMEGKPLASMATQTSSRHSAPPTACLAILLLGMSVVDSELPARKVPSEIIAQDSPTLCCYSFCMGGWTQWGASVEHALIVGVQILAKRGVLLGGLLGGRRLLAGRLLWLRHLSVL